MTKRFVFDSRQLARLRMQALGFGQTKIGDGTPRGVVGAHLAMQAQDFTASRWAVGSRVDACVEADVIASYDRGEIVRSWPMRGTVHVVEAPDLPWMLDLMGVRSLSGVKRRWEYLGIDEAFLERARDVALTLLRDQGRCTRAELVQACTEAGLEMSGQRAYHTVWYLSQTGTLVQGPVRDNDHELVLLDTWITSPRRLDRPEALAELGRRYVQARGPVTVDDLVHWTKLTKTDCRAAFEANRDVLVEVDGPGGPYLMLAEQLDTLDPDCSTLESSVHALAAFDEHLLGYRVRDCVLDPAHATMVDPARNGVFRWTLVAGGRVVATWKRVKLTRKIRAEITPFEPLDADVEARVPDALSAWGRFVGSPVVVA